MNGNFLRSPNVTDNFTILQITFQAINFKKRLHFNVKRFQRDRN